MNKLKVRGNLIKDNIKTKDNSKKRKYERAVRAGKTELYLRKRRWRQIVNKIFKMGMFKSIK